MDMASPGMFTNTACRSVRDLNLSISDEEHLFLQNSLHLLGPYRYDIKHFLATRFSKRYKNEEKNFDFKPVKNIDPYRNARL